MMDSTSRGFAWALVGAFVAQSAPTQAVGLWQSVGYGLFVEIDGDQIKTFQTTSISCMPWWTAHRSDHQRQGELVFDRGDAEVRVTAGESPDVMVMSEGTSIGGMTLRRVGSRPRTCADSLPDTPMNNYAVFWQTFAEEFVLFGKYHADWRAVDRTYRPRLTAATTPEQLFDLLREMIRPFRNAHTNITAGSIHRQYIGYRPASAIGRRLNATSSLSIDSILGMFAEQGRRADAVVESRYALGPLRSLANDVLHFGVLRDSIVYLRIAAFDGFAKDGSAESGARALEAALDEVIEAARSSKGLILDLRTNLGGADPLCLAVAARLTDVRYLAYSKVVRTNPDGPLRLSRPAPIWVEPSDRPRYRGPVVLLHGPETISGGETFLMALMGRRPRVVGVGENTQGVFSDVWGRRLPNGWTFGVPSEQYLTASGKSFDGIGVPPDVRVPVFRPGDFARNRDPAVERARMVVLRGSSSSAARRRREVLRQGTRIGLAAGHDAG